MKTSCRDRESYCEGSQDPQASGRGSFLGVGLGKQRPGYWPETLKTKDRTAGGVSTSPQGASLGSQAPPRNLLLSLDVCVQTWESHFASQSLSFLICKMGTGIALAL